MMTEVAYKNKATVTKFFKLLEDENIPDLIELFADDGKQINPYSSGLFPAGADGKDALTD